MSSSNLRLSVRQDKVKEALEVCRIALAEAGIAVGDRRRGYVEYRDGRMSVVERLDEVRFLLDQGESPEQVSRTLNWGLSAVESGARRQHQLDIARVFASARLREATRQRKLDKKKSMR